MRAEPERARVSSENTTADGSSLGEEPVSARASVEQAHAREDTGSEEVSEAGTAREVVGALQWWATVVLYTLVVVGLVIGCSSLARLVF